MQKRLMGSDVCVEIHAHVCACVCDGIHTGYGCACLRCKVILTRKKPGGFLHSITVKEYNYYQIVEVGSFPGHEW